MEMRAVMTMMMNLFTRGRAVHRDEIKARGMVMDIDRRGETNGEANGGRTILHPTDIIDTEIAIVPMTGAAIASSAAPKRKNVEARRQKKKSTAGATASLLVVITPPRRDGITVTEIEIATTILLRALSGRSKSKKTNLRVGERTTIVNWIEISPKKTRRGRRLHRTHNVFRFRKLGQIPIEAIL